MVLLAAAVCTKDGKALISRQFVEMSKTRIEGLIATFPKLINSGKQHTFLETEYVRYVYRPLEKLFVLLITTKASNILEDLETLRLFARVVPEYGGGTDEKDIIENAFQIIFAFDEIVALGYAEHVNISQIRTFIEMDSHDERVFEALRESQERDAKENMKRKAKELQEARIAAAKGRPVPSFTANHEIPIEEPMRMPLREDTYSKPQAPTKAKRGMQLGSAGGGNVDYFVSKLKAEGEVVASGKQTTMFSKASIPVPEVKSKKTGDLSVRLEEKVTLRMDRDGGLENMELHGILQIECLNESASMAKVMLDTSAASQGTQFRPPVQLQTHPNIDKKVFLSTGCLQTKANGKPYPMNNEISVLKWRMQTQDEAMIPLKINCWPNEIPAGFEVNIEYELLEGVEIELLNVAIRIPLPPSKANPQVSSCEGEYTVDGRRSHILWTVPVINQSNSTGSIEFTLKSDTGARADSFFPVSVDFNSDQSYCQIRVLEATVDDSPIEISQECSFVTNSYEIV